MLPRTRGANETAKDSMVTAAMAMKRERLRFGARDIPMRYAATAGA